MQRILLALKQRLHKNIFVLGLMTLISVASLFIAAQPSYAVLHSKNKLTPDERVDRAYQYSEATGLLEEDKQNSGNANEPFNYNEKANEKTVIKSKEENNEPNLIEKAQDLIQKVTGND
ncbi:hypothetical protein [Coleofasciculus sp. H7-2]|uniref:hypothetical protein n=1 Tax=Coleofasciculus sp. H7-2 TaxID=3351545 RepID=UPI00366DFD4D